MPLFTMKYVIGVSVALFAFRILNLNVGLPRFTNFKILPENDISWLKFFHSTYDCVSDMIAYILLHA